jgi:hypothetical protein
MWSSSAGLVWRCVDEDEVRARGGCCERDGRARAFERGSPESRRHSCGESASPTCIGRSSSPFSPPAALSPLLSLIQPLPLHFKYSSVSQSSAMSAVVHRVAPIAGSLSVGANRSDPPPAGGGPSISSGARAALVRAALSASCPASLGQAAQRQRLPQAFDLELPSPAGAVAIVSPASHGELTFRPATRSAPARLDPALLHL